MSESESTGIQPPSTGAESQRPLSGKKGPEEMAGLGDPNLTLNAKSALQKGFDLLQGILPKRRK